MTSYIGHLLWSGVVEESRAEAVAHHLGDRLFSVWGVRTMAMGKGRYDAIGYHVGTVLPFDNSFIVWGLRRYGFKDEAAVVGADIFEAAQFFAGRLREVFGGYPPAMTKYPVQYPTACSPQAWSTGAPLLLLRTIRGSTRSATTWSSTPRCPRASATSSCSTSRAGGGRVDAFGGGRVDTDRYTGRS